MHGFFRFRRLGPCPSRHLCNNRFQHTTSLLLHPFAGGKEVRALARKSLIVLVGALSTIWISAAPVLAYPWK
jgi:hypothetical protein